MSSNRRLSPIVLSFPKLLPRLTRVDSELLYVPAVDSSCFVLLQGIQGALRSPWALSRCTSSNVPTHNSGTCISIGKQGTTGHLVSLHVEYHFDCFFPFMHSLIFKATTTSAILAVSKTLDKWIITICISGNSLLNTDCSCYAEQKVPLDY